MEDEIMSNTSTIMNLHRCIKMHFTNKSYDCVEQEYKMRGAKTYKNRWLANTQSNYQKVISRFNSDKEIKLFFVVCCLNDKNEIFDIVNNFNILKDFYTRKLKIFKNLNTIFEIDCKYLIEKYGSISNSVYYSRNGLSGILISYQKKQIHIETLLILNHLFNIFETIERTGNTNELWKKDSFKIKKYGSFINNFDQETFINILTHVTEYVKMNNNKTNKG